MGLKNFYKVFEQRFSKTITPISPITYQNFFLYKDKHFNLSNTALKSIPQWSISHATSHTHQNNPLHLQRTSTYNHLLVDLNCVLRTHLRKRLFHFDSDSKERNDMLLYKKLFPIVDSHLDALIALFRPDSTVHLCLDGPGPLFKMPVQVKSRGKLDIRWINQLQVTPGTSLMNQYNQYSRNRYCPLLLEKFNQIEEVYFSSSDTPGEGEIKIFNHIHQLSSRNLKQDHYNNNNEKYIVCGIDTDLILLAVASLKANVDILLFKDHNEHKHIDIGLFIHEYLRPLSDNIDGVRLDFVLLGLLGGSDYVPKLGGEAAFHVWDNYVRLRLDNRSRHTSRFLVNRDESTGLFNFDIELLVQCMPASLPMGRQIKSMRSAEDIVISYFKAVMWNFEMMMNGRCPDYWFLPSDTILVPPVSEILEVYRNLGSAEFNRRINPRNSATHSDIGYKAPFLPHEICSAISPTGRRMFVPKSLQSVPCLPHFLYSKMDKITQVYDIGVMEQYRQLISQCIVPDDISTLEESSTVIQRTKRIHEKPLSDR